jgi:hypothetical protein
MAVRISGESFGHAETTSDSSEQSCSEFCEAPRETGGFSLALSPWDSTASDSFFGTSSPPLGTSARYLGLRQIEGVRELAGRLGNRRSRGHGKRGRNGELRCAKRAGTSI